MKKMIAFFFVVALVVGMAAGCTQKPDDLSETQTQATNARKLPSRRRAPNNRNPPKQQML